MTVYFRAVSPSGDRVARQTAEAPLAGDQSGRSTKPQGGRFKARNAPNCAAKPGRPSVPKARRQNEAGKGRSGRASGRQCHRMRWERRAKRTALCTKAPGRSGSARAAIRRQLERASSLYAPDPFLCWIKKTPRASLFKDRLAQGAKRPQRRRRIRRRMWSLLQTKSVFLRTAEHTISASDFLPSQNL